MNDKINLVIYKSKKKTVKEIDKEKNYEGNIRKFKSKSNWLENKKSKIDKIQ